MFIEITNFTTKNWNKNKKKKIRYLNNFEIMRHFGTEATAFSSLSRIVLTSYLKRLPKFEKHVLVKIALWTHVFYRVNKNTFFFLTSVWVIKYDNFFRAEAKPYLNAALFACQIFCRHLFTQMEPVVVAVTHEAAVARGEKRDAFPFYNSAKPTFITATKQRQTAGKRKSLEHREKESIRC